MQFRCPVCADKLRPDDTGRQLKCVLGHNFDRARQGYWNLLLAQQKRSKDPGDNAAMVAAREQFLALGLYQSISDQLNQLVLEQIKDLQDDSHNSIIDLGCGDGYYSSRLREHLNASHRQPELLGIDISKHAIKAACRRDPKITWAVASAANTPVIDKSFRIATVVFSRLFSTDLERIIELGGKLVVVYPGPKHLLSLRSLIYDRVVEKPYSAANELSPQFRLIDEQSVDQSIQLTSSHQISHLLAMTPHGQRIRSDKRAAIASLSELNTELDVKFAVFERVA